MNLVPFSDKVLLKRFVAEAATTGGLLLSDSSKDVSQVATVVSVGPKVIWFAPGDRVLMTKFSGANVSVDGEEYLIVREEDILGRFNE